MQGSIGSVTEAKQSTRILRIFPNYRAMSADTQLPPLSLRENHTDPGLGDPSFKYFIVR